MHYSEFKPTVFDNHIEIEDREDWLVVPVGQNRDSDAFSKANFEAALEILGGESETVEVHRFGHWGPGWFEIIIAHPDRQDDVDEIYHSLENYPVLDEEKLSEFESEEEESAWNNYYNRELNRYLPEWLENALDDLGAYHEGCEYDCFYRAMGKTNTYWEHYSDGASIDVERVAPAYMELLAEELDVEPCPECLGSGVLDEWDNACGCERGYVMRDYSHLNQLELPMAA